jgi:hypothetical protein
MRKHKGLQTVAAEIIAEVVPAAFVTVDFPQEKEVVTSPEYTLRLGASLDAAQVEVSIDGSDWKACRESVGFWWFDWSGYSKIAHKISGRVTTKDGRVVYGDPRSFSVRLNNGAGSAKKAPKASKTRKKLTKMLIDAGLSIG